MKPEYAKTLRWAAIACGLGLLVSASQLRPEWAGEGLAYNIGTLLGGGVGGAVIGGLTGLLVGVFGK